MKLPSVCFPHCALVLIAVGWMIACGGCGASGPEYPSAELAGNVRIGGQPISAGRIHFMPNPDTPGAPVTGEISGGQYTAEQVPLGNVIVTFSAVKETGKIIREGDREPYPETVSIIPEKYQQGIPLNVTGDNAAQDFDLLTEQP